MKVGLLIVALLTAGCSGYTWACGPDIAPYANPRQWPERLCSQGPR